MADDTTATTELLQIVANDIKVEDVKAVTEVAFDQLYDLRDSSEGDEAVQRQKDEAVERTQELINDMIQKRDSPHVEDATAPTEFSQNFANDFHEQLPNETEENASEESEKEISSRGAKQARAAEAQKGPGPYGEKPPKGSGKGTTVAAAGIGALFKTGLQMGWDKILEKIKHRSAEGAEAAEGQAETVGKLWQTSTTGISKESAKEAGQEEASNELEEALSARSAQNVWLAEPQLGAGPHWEPLKRPLPGTKTGTALATGLGSVIKSGLQMGWDKLWDKIKRKGKEGAEAEMKSRSIEDHLPEAAINKAKANYFGFSVLLLLFFVGPLAAILAVLAVRYLLKPAKRPATKIYNLAGGLASDIKQGATSWTHNLEAGHENVYFVDEPVASEKGALAVATQDSPRAHVREEKAELVAW